MKLNVFKDGKVILEKTLEAGQEYLIGRSAQCDILVVHPEISRRHAKLFFKNGVWECELLSPHGQLITQEKNSVKRLSLIDGASFNIQDFTFKCEEAERTIVLESSPSTKIETPAEEDLSEKTNVVVVSSKFALFKIDSNGEPFEEISLGLGLVEAGRSDECEIILSDVKASRKHFSIEGTNSTFVISDLDSTHGVMINGQLRKKHTLSPGDIIDIGKEKFVFQEIHPAFDNLPAVNPQPSNPQNQMAALRVDLRKNKNMKPLYVGLGVLFLVAVFLKSQPENKGPENNRVPTNNQSSASKQVNLTPEQKVFLENTYHLAMNLYTSGKYDMAALEIAKIFQLVPQYKDARNIEELCQQALEMKRQAEENEIARQEQNELKDKVDTILSECEHKFRAKRYSEVEACVSRITDMDPDNARATQLVQNAQERMDEVHSNKEAAKEAQRRLKLAEQTFDRGHKSFKEKRYPAAINDFTTVTKISFNDKNGLKQKASEGIRVAKEKMKEDALIFVQEGRRALDDKDYKNAVIKFNKALKISANLPEANELKERAYSELRVEMKNIYSESVIEENLGNIESAKKKWRTILEQDVPTDDYYEKAKSKLSKYER